MAKLKCAKCGTEISEENLTCSSCGCVNDLEIVNKLMSQEREQEEKEQIQKEALKKEQDINKRRQLYDYAKKIRKLFQIPQYLLGGIALIIIMTGLYEGLLERDHFVWFSTLYRNLFVISCWAEISLVSRLNMIFAPAKIAKKAKEIGGITVLDGIEFYSDKDCDSRDCDALEVANHILTDKESNLQKIICILAPIKLIVEFIGFYFIMDALFYALGMQALFDVFPILNVKTYIAVGVWVAIIIMHVIFSKIVSKEKALHKERKKLKQGK